jgi:hypothetical protein
MILLQKETLFQASRLPFFVSEKTLAVHNEYTIGEDRSYLSGEKHH